MPLSLRFLGTAASRPTVERGVPSLAVVREGDTYLFDCGEGTQRQMLRYGVSFALGDIFFTHFHTDHFLGLIGLMRTMGMQERREPLRLWGPRGAVKWVRKAEGFGGERLPFPVDVRELEPGEAVERPGHRIATFALQHRGTPSLGYAVVEEERRGRFDPERARALGIPEGPLWGRLHRGEAITLPDGTIVTSETLVGPTRPGRTVVITGDTRPCRATIEAARDADLLVHESTFAEEEHDRAVETGHSTAREAAEVARDAGVLRLVLTHFSSRYSRDARELEREATRVFPRVTIAKDGLELTVPFRDEVDEPPVSADGGTTAGASA